ncbi:hypothetical protein CPB85DRAFT_1503211 [Mucidula mucida]|nr:hypothetical protein CPB85DRAFT_1503211 [Mucidula mucida]
MTAGASKPSGENLIEEKPPVRKATGLPDRKLFTQNERSHKLLKTGSGGTMKMLSVKLPMEAIYSKETFNTQHTVRDVDKNRGEGEEEHEKARGTSDTQDKAYGLTRCLVTRGHKLGTHVKGARGTLLETCRVKPSTPVDVEPPLCGQHSASPSVNVPVPHRGTRHPLEAQPADGRDSPAIPNPSRRGGHASDTVTTKYSQSPTSPHGASAVGHGGKDSSASRPDPHRAVTLNGTWNKLFLEMLISSEQSTNGLALTSLLILDEETSSASVISDRRTKREKSCTCLLIILSDVLAVIAMRQPGLALAVVLGGLSSPPFPETQIRRQRRVKRRRNTNLSAHQQPGLLLAVILIGVGATILHGGWSGPVVEGRVLSKEQGQGRVLTDVLCVDGGGSKEGG